MIVQFRPLNTETFTGTFNGRRLDIVKRLDSSWRVFIDQVPSNVIADSARSCMEIVDSMTTRIIKQKVGLSR